MSGPGTKTLRSANFRVSLSRIFSAYSLRCGFALLLLNIGVASASVRKIGPDLYAYISENDSSANSTFLVAAGGILVVENARHYRGSRTL